MRMISERVNLHVESMHTSLLNIFVTKDNIFDFIKLTQKKAQRVIVNMNIILHVWI